MNMKINLTNRLVKSEDLNHHTTLFAGRTAEWVVESSFIAVAKELNPQNIVCKNIHGIEIKKPVRNGSIVEFSSKIVYVGRTSITTFTNMIVKGEEVVRAFITFIYVDNETKPAPHNLTLDLTSEEDIKLNEEAKQILGK